MASRRRHAVLVAPMLCLLSMIPLMGHALDIGAFYDAMYRCGPAPVYPDAQAVKGVVGEAWVLVRVDAHGNAHHARIAASSGDRALDRAAVHAVQDWRFCPRIEGSRKIEAMAVFPVRFGQGAGIRARDCKTERPSCSLQVPVAKAP